MEVTTLKPPSLLAIGTLITEYLFITRPLGGESITSTETAVDTGH